MKKNLGTMDRLVRTVFALAMLTCSVIAPLPFLLRVLALGGSGAYLLFSALAGSCVGYHLIGKSSCAVESGS